MIFRAVILAALIVGLVPSAALADKGQSASVSWSRYGFTSPGDLYGPWTIVDMQLRAAVPRGSVGLEAVSRMDSDRLNPQHGSNVVVDNYHDWTGRFYTYAAAAFGSGQYAARSLYLEGDAGLAPATGLAFGFGGQVAALVDGSSQRSLSFGPTLYRPKFVATYRYLPLWNSNGAFTGQHLAAMTFGEERKGTVTLTLESSSGTEANRITGLGGAPAAQGQHATSIDLAWKRWLTKSSGIRVGTSYARLVQAGSGALVFENHGLTLGVFTESGR